MKALISYEDAIERTLRGLTRLGSERVPIDGAAWRVLAADIQADADMPAFSYSAMDGYAVRSRYFEQNEPWSLAVRGESRAGRASGPLQHGVACRIFTGARVPIGADAVVPQEAVTRTGEQVSFSERPRAGQNIRPQGADLKAGQTALHEGDRLSPGKLGLAAALDRAWLLVARQPVVTVVGTGDELRPPGTPGPPESIAESNTFVLAAVARRAGAIVRTMPMLADDADHTETALRRALKGTDVLVTIGGVSVGDHDLVRPALEAVGVTNDFWGVAIKPGKPIAAGHTGTTRVLSLPGNPASATLTFLLFGVPLLRAMQGDRKPRPRALPLRIIGSHARRPGRDEYLRARLEMHDGELCAALPASQSSGAVTSFADAEALVVLGADSGEISNGDRLPVILLTDLWS